MRIPLHIKPTDMSPSACSRRLMDFAEMASLNPAGFRTPSRRSAPTRWERLGRIAEGEQTL